MHLPRELATAPAAFGRGLATLTMTARELVKGGCGVGPAIGLAEAAALAGLGDPLDWAEFENGEVVAGLTT